MVSNLVLNMAAQHFYLPFIQFVKIFFKQSFWP